MKKANRSRNATATAPSAPAASPAATDTATAPSAQVEQATGTVQNTPSAQVAPAQEVAQPQAPAQESPLTVEAPSYGVFDVVKQGLKTVTNRHSLLSLLERLQDYKPAKPVFSENKAERKGQMVAYKIADKRFRAALGLVYRHAEDCGWGDHSDRHSASVTKTGIVTLRRSESLKIGADGYRFTL